MANRAAPTVYGDAPVADGTVSEAARVVPSAGGDAPVCGGDAPLADAAFLAGARAVP